MIRDISSLQLTSSHRVPLMQICKMSCGTANIYIYMHMYMYDSIYIN